MRISDVIDKFVLIESTSLSSTVKSVTSEIGNPITQIFDQMESAVYNFHANRGTIKGIGLILGGIGGRWYHSNYSNNLETELHHLAQQAGYKGNDLKSFLRHGLKGFGEISSSLTSILAKLGNDIGVKELTRNARAWSQQRSDFLTFMHSFKEADDDTDTITRRGKGKPIIIDPDNPAPVPVARSNPAVVSQQSAQVDKIISNVLSNLPSGVAGDIRKAIARSDNKMKALMAELNRRNIEI